MASRPEQVNVDLDSRSYHVYVAPGMFACISESTAQLLNKFVSGCRVMLVSDSHVAPLYASDVMQTLLHAGAESVILHTFDAGESQKTFATVESICRDAAVHKLDRTSVFVGLGGGVTTDLTGFAASIYMRGTAFISIPTSLLAMIDAGIGGKTGADLPEGKNLIGTFWQPRIVLMDVSCLHTLTPDQMRCGCAELVKHAILFDPDLFALLEETAQDFMARRSPEQSARIIAWSCRLKSVIVSRDEREGGTRALLNLGHSFGHAMEKLKNFQLDHGDAVAIGIAMAVTLSVRLHYLREKEALRIVALMRSIGLPDRISGLKASDIFEAMQGDKKNRHGHIRLIIPCTIGSAAVMDDIETAQILSAIEEHCD